MELQSTASVVEPPSTVTMEDGGNSTNPLTSPSDDEIIGTGAPSNSLTVLGATSESIPLGYYPPTPQDHRIKDDDLSDDEEDGIDNPDDHIRGERSRRFYKLKGCCEACDRKVDISEDDIAFTITLNNVQMRAYFSFWLTVVVGMVITTFFADIDFGDTLLTEVFGYNNICVYFDFPPATYVLPSLWAFTLIQFVAWVGSWWVKIQEEHQVYARERTGEELPTSWMERGRLSDFSYRLLTACLYFSALMFIFFSTIFAVSPEEHNHTLYIHTAPFFGLQLGVVVLAYADYYHGTVSGYWKRLELPEWFAWVKMTWVFLLTVTVLFKIPAAINAMAFEMWWKQTPSFVLVAKIFDFSFFINGALVPSMRCLYFHFARRKRLETIIISTRII